MHQLSPISKFSETGIIGDDWEEIPVDVVIFCTGYEFEFPFLDPNTSGIRTDNWRVSPLYLHMVNIDEPSMFFIGLCLIVFPFPFFDVQIEFAVSTLNKVASLPSRSEMLDWEKSDYERRRDVLMLPNKKCHFLGPMQWDYLHELARMGKFELRVLPVIEKMYQHIREYRNIDLLGYHSVNYKVISKDNFVVVNRGDQ